MTAVIQSLYFPHVEKNFDANYIAQVMSKHKLAKVSSVHIEPYEITNQQQPKLYNRAYVQIHEWQQGAAAHAFIRALHNQNVETRLVHSDDNWWAVAINPHSP